MNVAAQNQHYVPKFILRNFLSNHDKEQVSVFRKSTGKGFTTGIRNIMAERRFHEFAMGDDYLASFEEAVCRIEDEMLPTYRRIVDQRRLDGSAEERARLSLFVAFQFVRTRQQREQFVRMEQQIAEHLTKHGGSIEQLEGYEPLTRDKLTEQHISFIRTAVPEFAEHISRKEFLLLSAPPGRSFYLADNPVCMHNSQPPDPMFGNVGLAVEGIEIYMPLSSDLMLAAWCPSLLGKVRAERDRQKNGQQAELIAMLARGEITAEIMRRQMENLSAITKSTDDLLMHAAAGTPAPMNDSNMDFSNSLQLNYAGDYVVCKQADFRLARRFVAEFPGHTGRRMAVM